MTSRKVWTPERVERLRQMIRLRPRPPIEEIASAFGATNAAVSKAIYRYVNGRKGSDLRNYRKPTMKDHLRQRPCITCADPFASEGNWNRMCGRCRHLSMGIAA